VYLLPPTTPLLSGGVPGENMPLGATHIALSDGKLLNPGTLPIPMLSFTIPDIGTRSVSDFQAFALYFNGERISASVVPDLTTNSVTFNFEYPFQLQPNVIVAFRVKGNLESELVPEVAAGGPHHNFQMTPEGIGVPADVTRRGETFEGAHVGIDFYNHAPTLYLTPNSTLVNPPPFSGEEQALTGAFSFAARGGHIVVVDLGLAGQSAGPNLVITNTDGNPKFLCDGMSCSSLDCGMIDLLDGNGMKMWIHNDIFGSYDGEEIKFFIKDEFDVYAFDDSHPYGYGSNIEFSDFDGENCVNADGDCSYTRIDDRQQLDLAFNAEVMAVE